MSCFLLKDIDAVFIHVPKTAGVSIRQGVFRGRWEKEWLMPKRWEDKYAFAIVRNPYDRLISAWKMLTKGTDFIEHQSDISLHDFVDIAMDESIPCNKER